MADPNTQDGRLFGDPGEPGSGAHPASALLDAIEAALAGSREDIDPIEWLNIRAEVGRRVLEFNRAAAQVDRVLGFRSAKARLREYLLANLGQVLTGDALAGVAGISEWARRLRELELEAGWSITAGPDGGLKLGTYRLDAAEVDEDKAAQWRTRNAVRRQDGAGIGRLLSYLQAIYPAVASKEDLAYVSKINEWPRRMRELEEAGWDIISNVDDPTLPPGSYTLGSLVQGPPRSRQAIKQRADILRRDNWSCQDCGRSPKSSPGTTLQVHHLHQVQHGGGNEDDNLVTLCHPCHAGRHAISGAAMSQVQDELLNPAADLGLE